MAEETYDKEIPAATRDGFSDPTVRKALSIMNEWNNLNNSEFNRREYLNKLADLSMSDSESPASTPKKVNNQLSYVAVRKVNKQMSDRIFVVTGGKMPAEKRAVVKKAYIRFLELAGYRTTWLDHIMMLRIGDQFLTAGANNKYFESGRGFPYTIAKKSITQLFFPGWVTSLTDKGDNRHAKQYVEIVFDGEWDEAVEKYPWLVENGGTKGVIPMNKDDWNLNTQNERQRAYNSKRRTQVCRMVDETKRIIQFFGGSTAVPGERLEGEEFPHVDRFDETTKNVFHKQCFKLSNGLLAAGILQSTHKLSVLDGILQSIGFTFEIINLNAIKIVKTGMDPSVFKTEYNQALKDQMNLKEGVIYSKEDIAMESTHGKSFLIEMFQSLEQLIKNFARLDIIIDDSLQPTDKRVGVARIEQASRSAGVKELQEQNAPEEQRFHDFTTDWILQNIEDDNDVELPGIGAKVFDSKGNEKIVNGRTIQDEFGNDVFVNYTCGNLAQSIRDEGIRFEIVPTSGIKPNEAVSRENAEQNLNRYAALGLNALVKQELRKIKILDGESETDLDFLEKQEVADGATGGGLGPNKAPTPAPPPAPKEE